MKYNGYNSIKFSLIYSCSISLYGIPTFLNSVFLTLLNMNHSMNILCHPYKKKIFRSNPISKNLFKSLK